MERIRQCSICRSKEYDKGRAFDGRRAYRCSCCGNVWTEGMQGRDKNYKHQRQGFQFHNTGSTNVVPFNTSGIRLKGKIYAD